MRRALTTFWVALLILSGCSDSKPRRSLILMYGDSIMRESEPTIKAGIAQLRKFSATIHDYPGFALCDWTATLTREVHSTHPALVVIETVGNGWTQCMHDANDQLMAIGTPAYYTQYRKDFRKVLLVTKRANVPLWMIETLPIGTTFMQDVTARLHQIVLDEARSFNNFTFKDGPKRSVAPDGRFVARLPCRAEERTSKLCGPSGDIVIREPAGLHFCPAGYTSNEDIVKGCRVYSSGAVRYGEAVVAELKAFAAISH